MKAASVETRYTRIYLLQTITKQLFEEAMLHVFLEH